MCGMIENSENGVEAVVFYQYDKIEILNVGNMEWRDGPSMPDDSQLTFGAAVVQFCITYFSTS